MKHFLTAACALVACAGITTPILAGSFGLFYAGRHCSDRGAVIIRPYNAFTPVLCGDCPGGGGCGAGGCGPQGCGAGGGNGCDPGYRMCGRLAPIGAPCAGAYTGALGYGPKDGYGIGAFGTQGCGCFHVFGRPSWGGCCSSGKCGYGGPDFVSGYVNGYTGSPEGCSAQGYGAQGYNTGGGSGEGYKTEGYTPATPGQGEILQPVPTTKPELIPVPKTPGVPSTPPSSPTSTKTLATPVPRSATPPGVGAQPVSYYYPGYMMPAQQMMPNAYAPAGWGYPGYAAYPAYGYNGYGMPMTYPAWGYPQGYRQGW